MIEEKLKGFILEHFLHGEGVLKNSESLFGSGIVDSLRLMELIAFVEKTFNISVNMSDVTIKNFDSVNKISGLIKNKQHKRTQ